MHDIHDENIRFSAPLAYPMAVSSLEESLNVLVRT